MVAPVADIDNTLIGIHTTFLKSDGSGKYPFSGKSLQRECRGMVRGGAIRLGEFDLERELIVAEGVETTLSAMQILGLPGWSAVSAGGLRTIELPSVVRNIVIAADNDHNGAGQCSALAAYDRWTDEGRSVRIRCPSMVGHDYNDILVGRSRR
jgi:putative DNA primase/helicase